MPGRAVGSPLLKVSQKMLSVVITQKGHLLQTYPGLSTAFHWLLADGSTTIQLQDEPLGTVPILLAFPNLSGRSSENKTHYKLKHKGN